MGLFDRFFGRPTEAKFARIILDRLRRAGDDRQSTYDEAEFRLLHVKDGKQAGTTNLRNLFAEYCRAPANEREAMLTRTIQGFVNRMEIPEEFEDVKPDLLPAVRSRAMLEVLRLDSEISGGKPTDLPNLPLNEHLVVCLVYDLPTSMRFVTQKNLDVWGVTLYEAIEAARHNLQERPFSMLACDEKLFILESGDAYDGTRLLLTDHIQQLELRGQPVAMPITRDCLLIAGSDDLAALAVMATIATKKQDEARPLCAIPMLLAGDDWETWRLTPDHPLFGQFREIEITQLYSDYAEQKKLLEKRNEQVGRDVFVATFSAITRGDELLSYGVWSKGVATWLPKTDYIGLFDPETKSHQFVLWERLQDVVGGMMTPLDQYPPRWSVSEFPTDEQIMRMQPEDWSKESP